LSEGLQVQHPPAPMSWRRGVRRWSVRVPAWSTDIALVVVAFWLYSIAQLAAPLHRLAAMDHGRALLRAESVLHVDVELKVNTWLAAHRAVATIADYHYASVHFVLPLAILLWLRLRHPAAYRPALRALVITCLLALVVFWYLPVAPPRLLPGAGYVDTVLAFHTYGSGASATDSLAADQFASVPSLHMAWALWCCWALYPLLRSRWTRGLALAHPVATAFIVVATGNHYLIDLGAGALVLAAGIAIATYWQRVGAAQVAGAKVSASQVDHTGRPAPAEVTDGAHRPVSRPDDGVYAAEVEVLTAPHVRRPAT
jgi:hypothetical protein